MWSPALIYLVLILNLLVIGCGDGFFFLIMGNGGDDGSMGIWKLDLFFNGFKLKSCFYVFPLCGNVRRVDFFCCDLVCFLPA